MWVSSELAGYSTFPGLSNVIKVSKRVKHLKRGEWVESEQYVVASLSDIDPKRALSLVQGHWGDREQIVPCLPPQTIAIHRSHRLQCRHFDDIGSAFSVYPNDQFTGRGQSGVCHDPAGPCRKGDEGAIPTPSDVDRTA